MSGAANRVPDYIMADEVFQILSEEAKKAALSLSKQMSEGKDPSFENVSGIFTKMKYPVTIVGVKEHMGKFLISWDGAIVCPPMYLSFEVGANSEPIGEKEENISRCLQDGYLPIVVTSYKHDGLIYEETVFGYSEGFSTGKPLVAYIRMKIKNPSSERKSTKLSVWFRGTESYKTVPCKKTLRLEGHKVLDQDGSAVCWLKDQGAKFEDDRLRYELALEPGEEKELDFRMPHRPVPAGQEKVLAGVSFDKALEQAKAFWKGLVEKGMEINVPEDIVNNAYRTWLINNFMLAQEDKSKQYYEVHDAPFFYESVYGYAASMYLNTISVRGYYEEAKKCADMFFKLQRNTGVFSGKQSEIPHQNGSIIYTLCQLYRRTRDDEWFKSVVPNIIRGCNSIIDVRSRNKKLVDNEKTVTYGLLDPYRYCEDGVGADTDAQEYLGNAWCWAGLNQAAIAIEEFGGELKDEAARLKKEADEYRADILASMDKAMIKEGDLHFLPMVVSNKKPFKTLQESTLSHYYNILAPRMLESEIFDTDDERAHWVPDFLEARDGLILGLARWVGEGGIDPHFIAGYGITNLRLGRIDKFLLTFYGLICYGMARETYSTQECSFIVLGGAHYFRLTEKDWASSRQPHLHSSSELTRLLHMMLVKEERDELWVAYGVPRKWLADGQKIDIRKAHTCYGELDFSIKSGVSKGIITAKISASISKAPSAIRLKLRHPEAKKIKSVKVNGKDWTDFRDEVINLKGLDGDITITAYYNK